MFILIALGICAASGREAAAVIGGFDQFVTGCLQKLLYLGNLCRQLLFPDFVTTVARAVDLLVN